MALYLTGSDLLVMYNFPSHQFECGYYATQVHGTLVLPRRNVVPIQPVTFILHDNQPLREALGIKELNNILPGRSYIATYHHFLVLPRLQ